MPADEVPENFDITGKDGVVIGEGDVVTDENDVVIRDVPLTPCGNPQEPVVPLAGWVRYLAHPETETAAALRLYIDPCFEEWLEIPADKVVTSIKGDIRPSHDGRSLLWVVADTIVTKWTVRTEKARFFSRPEPDRRGFDEPSGGTGGGYGGPPGPPTGHR
jgi:hypothetical protein